MQLHVAFAEFDGVQDIRLIRDRVTKLSRGFGFIEFRDIEVWFCALFFAETVLTSHTAAVGFVLVCM